MGATGHSFHEKGEAGAHESMTKTIDNNEDPVWDEEFTLAYDVVRSRQWWAGVKRWRWARAGGWIVGLLQSP